VVLAAKPGDDNIKFEEEIPSQDAAARRPFSPSSLAW
jgi:hypothetical protein